MKMDSNTILITGGTSGIGFELAAQLLQLGNTVIITGRDQSKLDLAKKKLSNVHTFQCDVSDPKAISDLYEKVISQFPELNFLINNAGVMRKLNFHTKEVDLEGISSEIEINLSGSIRMAKPILIAFKNEEIRCDNECLICTCICSVSGIASILCDESRYSFIYTITANAAKKYEY